MTDVRPRVAERGWNSVGAGGRHVEACDGAAAVVISHPARQHSYHTALAAQDAGLLLRYVTAFYSMPLVALTTIISGFQYGRACAYTLRA